MNLNHIELKELNSFLSNNKLNLPDFRRTVTSNGTNYTWLQRNIITRNPGINDRLKSLLNIKIKKN